MVQPVEHLEIVVNGEVVASKENKSGNATVEFEGKLQLDKSSWIAARAYASQRLPFQSHLTGKGSPLLAHTSPVYVDINGAPRVSAGDAAFLVKICDETIHWAKTMAHYHDEKQRAEVISLYEKAREIYARQIGPE